MGGLQAGQMLEGTPYRVVREIGAGGMGVVYEVEHVRLGKRYVAKVLHEAIRDERGSVERMDREAKVLASFAHPNVVQVHDVGTTVDGVHYFVMDKLEGIDLRRCIGEQGVSRMRAAEIVTDVLRALDYVHRRGVIHRDVKPENIFLAEEVTGTVTKVLDFGIVHVFGGDAVMAHAPITRTGGFVGTLRYAAPEHLEGKPLGPAADVYAVGLVLFELIAGKGPFDDESGVGLGRCLGPAPRLGTMTHASHELDALVGRVLDRDPAARPTAIAFAAELTVLGARITETPAKHIDAKSRGEAERRVKGDVDSKVEADVDRQVRDDVDDLLLRLGGPSPARAHPARRSTGVPTPTATPSFAPAATPIPALAHAVPPLAVSARPAVVAWSVAAGVTGLLVSALTGWAVVRTKHDAAPARGATSATQGAAPEEAPPPATRNAPAPPEATSAAAGSASARPAKAAAARVGSPAPAPATSGSARPGRRSAEAGYIDGL